MNDDIKKVLENKATEYSRRAETLYPPNIRKQISGIKKLAYTAGATEFYPKGDKDGYNRALDDAINYRCKDCCQKCKGSICVITGYLHQLKKKTADETPTK